MRFRYAEDKRAEQREVWQKNILMAVFIIVIAVALKF